MCVAHYALTPPLTDSGTSYAKAVAEAMSTAFLRLGDVQYEVPSEDCSGAEGGRKER